MIAFSEAELKSRFDVSSTTAVKVLNLLQTENRVTRIKGRGTFVAKESHRRVVYLTDLNMAKTEPEWTKVLSVAFGDDPVVRQNLRLADKEAYVVIKRLRMIGDQAVQCSIDAWDSSSTWKRCRIMSPFCCASVAGSGSGFKAA